MPDLCVQSALISAIIGCSVLSLMLGRTEVEELSKVVEPGVEDEPARAALDGDALLMSSCQRAYAGSSLESSNIKGPGRGRPSLVDGKYCVLWPEDDRKML